MAHATFFPTDPILGFPHFNTYRLASSSALKASANPLPSDHCATSSRLKSTSRGRDGKGNESPQFIGLKDVKARVGWDHLANGAWQNEIVYVDEEYRVVVALVSFVQGKPSVNFRQIAELVVPLERIGSSLTDPLPLSEYPSVLSIPPTQTTSGEAGIYLASSGVGNLSLISIPTVGAEQTHTVELDLVLPGETSQGYPFLLHSLHVHTLSSVEVILTRTVRAPDITTPSPVPGSAKSARTAPKVITTFEVICIDLDLSPGSSIWEKASGSKFNIKWRLAGEDFPTLITWSGDRWIIGGPCLYEEVIDGSKIVSRRAEAALPANGDDQSQDEGLRPEQVRAASSAEPPEYAYSWSQSHSNLTITFAFPGYLNSTRDILCVIKTNTLLLRLSEDRRDALTKSQATFFRLSSSNGMRDWWDAVKGDESTWTWEKSSSPGGTGTMTLHLEKANAGVKWPQAFAPLQNDGDELVEGDGEAQEAAQDVEVPETVSEEEQTATRARLKQFHSAAAEAGMGGIGSSNALPGLLREEMEDEDYDDEEGGDLDGGDFASLGASGSSKAGKPMRFTEVMQDEDGRPRIRRFDKEPVAWILSCSVGSSSGTPTSVIVKSHVDGQVFKPPMSSKQAGWTHTATNPALSFVLSSKRDAQYVYHIDSAAGATVIAFESRQANGVGGNAYVYWPIDDGAGKGKTASGKSKADEGRQAVVKMDEDANVDTGSLLGVKLVLVDGLHVLVCLTEKALLFLTGL